MTKPAGRVLKTMFVSAALLVSGKASACSDLPNICEQQEQVYQQNLEYGREEAEAYAEWAQDEYYNDQGQAPVAPPPPVDPMQSHLNNALSIVLEAGRKTADLATLKKDPKYKAFVNGAWSYFQDAKNPAPGEFCSAFFTRKDGFIMLSGPGSDYQGAMITFWAMEIPRPKSVRKIKVTLKQSNDKPQTVTAFNYYNPAQGMAAIAFAVPSIEAALDGITDTLSFELVTGGKTVAKVSWHSGLKMKQKLSACVAKRK